MPQSFEKSSLAEAERNYKEGLRLEEGLEVPQNYSEAARFYRLTANQGHPFAQNSLGVFYCEGRGVPQDDKEAAKLFRLAADQGDAEAQEYLKNNFF